MQTLSIFPECTIAISNIDDGSIHTYEDLSVLNLKTHPEQLVYLPTHAHTTDIWVIKKENKDQVVFTADIVLTDQKHAIVAHQFADCVPFLLVDRKRRTLCFAHFGWRGLLRGGIQIAILAMQAQYASQPGDLWVWIGPCIRKSSYKALSDPAQLQLPEWQQHIEDCAVESTPTWSIDLPGYIMASAAHWGIDPERIIDDGRDTFISSEHFFSHQRAVHSHDSLANGNFIVTVGLQ